MDSDSTSTHSPVPRFLKFLCYLTIFGSIYMVLSSISGLTNPEGLSQTMSKSIDEWQSIFEKPLKADPASEQKLDQILSDINNANTSGNMRDNSFFSLISNILTLLGGWYMLRLQKRGFHFYLIGNIIAVIAPLLVFGSNNFLGFSYALYAGLTGGLFIILYALKIKHMH